ncbi:MAG: hypothetical protein Q4A30_01705 [Candidatus Saccharibacteria bacterium]|nr:hypothetical protein [Candidatus Saccharibacteria bacterium]
MADYILIRKGRNILSSILHLVFNLVLGIGSIFLTIITGSWTLGVVLVFLSKWRMFAVRPRYWWLNLKSNLVDLIVGISLILITYCSGTSLLPIHFILAAAYALWLILIKPRSGEIDTEAQALIAVFLGTTAATLMSANANASFLVISAFIIGYGASRHILAQSEEHDFTLTTLVAGLLAAEIAWLCHSWLIVYIFAGTGIIIPQLAIFLTLITFVFNQIYKSLFKHDGKLKLIDIAMPTVFTLLIITIIILWFSKPIFDV